MMNLKLIKLNLIGKILVWVVFYTIVTIQICSAQGSVEKKNIDRIILKNGKIIQGEILENIRDQYIKIRLLDGAEEQYGSDEVKKFVYDYKAGYTPRKRGYFNATSIALMFGRPNDFDGPQAYPSIQTVNGFRFNQYLALGLGVGYNLHDFIGAMPVFLSARGTISDKKTSPYYHMDIGYGHAWEESSLVTNWNSSVEGGLYLNPGAGLQVNFHRLALLLGLSYQIQKVTIRAEPNEWVPLDKTEREFRRVNFSVGVMF